MRFQAQKTLVFLAFLRYPGFQRVFTLSFPTFVFYPQNHNGAYPLILEDRTEGFYGKKAILIVEAKEFSQGIVYIFTD